MGCSKRYARLLFFLRRVFVVSFCDNVNGLICERFNPFKRFCSLVGRGIRGDMNGYLLESIAKRHRNGVIDKLKWRDL
jgi:hypothetical protein